MGREQPSGYITFYGDLDPKDICDGLHDACSLAGYRPRSSFDEMSYNSEELTEDYGVSAIEFKGAVEAGANGDTVLCMLIRSEYWEEETGLTVPVLYNPTRTDASEAFTEVIEHLEDVLPMDDATYTVLEA